MQLQAVIVPPADVLDDVFAAAQTLRFAADEEVVEEQRTGLLQRIGRRGSAQAPPPLPPLEVKPEENRFTRLTRFGNVSSDDAETLGIALGIAAWDWPAPVVHVSGLEIDTTAYTPVITAKLGGDTDGLRVIFGKVLEVAQSQRFFLDRRIFHPKFPVANVEVAEDPELRERLEFAPDLVLGRTWQVTHFSLLRLSFGADTRIFEELAIVPLSGGSA